MTKFRLISHCFVFFLLLGVWPILADDSPATSQSRLNRRKSGRVEGSRERQLWLIKENRRRMVEEKERRKKAKKMNGIVPLGIGGVAAALFPLAKVQEFTKLRNNLKKLENDEPIFRELYAGTKISCHGGLSKNLANEKLSRLDTTKEALKYCKDKCDHQTLAEWNRISGKKGLTEADRQAHDNSGRMQYCGIKNVELGSEISYEKDIIKCSTNKPGAEARVVLSLSLCAQGCPRINPKKGGPSDSPYNPRDCFTRTPVAIPGPVVVRCNNSERDHRSFADCEDGVSDVFSKPVEVVPARNRNPVPNRFQPTKR